MIATQQSSPKIRRTTVLVFLILLAAGSTARAQYESGESQSRVSSGLLLDFSIPGSRSLAMGGAFLGFADDATAAYTNPAGLTNLVVGGPEVAVEARSRSQTALTPYSGRVHGTPTGIGLDTEAGLAYLESESSTAGLSFLSVGYVLPHGVALALYRHELAHSSFATESQGFFFGLDPYSEACQTAGRSCLFGRFAASQGFQDLQIVNYGASAAYEIPRSLTRWQDSLSLGLGISVYQLDASAVTAFYGGYGPSGYPAVDRQTDGFFGPNGFLDDQQGAELTTSGEGTKVGLSLGWLWKFGAAKRWGVGGVYRKGAELALERVLDTAAGSRRLPDRQLRIPDSYGLGVAYSTNDSKTRIALDYNRIRYSQQLAGEVQAIRESFGPLVHPGDFKIPDADQVHLGFEQVIPIVEPQLVGTFRLGSWYEPSHALDYRGQSNLLYLLYDDDFFYKQDIHYTGGIGLVIKESFQIDLAADLSDFKDTFSVSLVKFF